MEHKAETAKPSARNGGISLATRIAVTVSALLVVTAGIIDYVLVSASAADLAQASREHIETIARLLAEAGELQSPAASGGGKALETLMAGLPGQSNIVGVDLYGHSGELLARAIGQGTDLQAPGLALGETAARDALAAHAPRALSAPELGLLVAAAPLALDSGDAAVVIYQDTASMQAAARAASLRGILVAAVGALVAVFASIWLARSITRPLRQLGQAARGLARGDWLQYVPPAGVQEIDVLRKAFRSMSEQLRELYADLETKVDQRTLEAEAARRDAEEANRLKTQFLANMSHELRTPLNSVIAFADLMLTEEDPREPLTETQRDSLMRISAAGQHLLGLINDVLDLAKIESGHMGLSLESVDVAQVVTSVMSTAVGLVRNRPIELRRAVPEDLPPVRADRKRVRQVLLNLVSNASKFTQRGHLAVRATYDEQWVTVSVEDSGIGIRPEDIPKAFTEFVQIDGDLTRRVGGTGLGLPISKRFIEMHGGRMWVESEPGAGSTFYFTLPRWSRPVGAETPGGVPAQARVLIAGDDAAARQVIANQLASTYPSIRLADSDHVLEELRLHPPDVVVLDLVPPGPGRSEAFARLRTSPATRNLPVVVLTASDLTREEGEQLQQAASAALRKGQYTAEELVGAVRRALVDARRAQTGPAGAADSGAAGAPVAPPGLGAGGAQAAGAAHPAVPDRTGEHG